MGFFDLDSITLFFTVNEEECATALNMMARSPLMGDHLHQAVDYDYDQLRTWLWEAGRLHEDVPLSMTVQNQAGEYVGFRVTDKWTFGACLQLIRNGNFILSETSGYGYVLTVEPCDFNVPQEPQIMDQEQCQVQDQEHHKQQDDGLEVSRQKEPSPQVQPNDQDVQPAGEQQPEQRDDHHSGLQMDEQQVVRSPSPTLSEHNASTEAAALEPGEPANDLTVEDPQEDDDDREVEVIDLTSDHEGVPTEARMITVDAAQFRRAERFFQTSKGQDGKYKIKAIAKTIHDYQLYTLYGLFMSPLTTGVNGALIGWGMGFRKTCLILIYLRARARLAELWRKIQEEWRDGFSGDRRHLPNADQPAGACCPAQRGSMVECPCVESSDARRVCETYLSNTPAIIILPSSQAINWLEQMRQFYKDAGTTSDEMFMSFYTCVSKLKDVSTVRPKEWTDVVENTRGKAKLVKMDVDDPTTWRKLVANHTGTATDVFLVGNMSVMNVIKRYPEASDTGATSFTAGVFIMDEFHLYRGAGSEDTLPFQALKTVSDAAAHPVTLFTLCGTTLEEGPSAWKSPIEHFTKQWDDFSIDGTLSSNDGTPTFTTKAFVDIRRQYYTMVRRLVHENASEKDLAREIEELVRFLKPMMYCLRQNQVWNGRHINPVPPCHQQHKVLAPQMDEQSTTAFKALQGGVQTVLNRTLRTSISEWEKGDRRDVKPTMESLIEKYVGDGKSAWAGWRDLQRCLMYPYLAVLVEKDELGNRKLDPKVLSADTCKVAGDTCHKTFQQLRDVKKAKETLKTWELTPYLDALEQNSAKLGYIKSLIRNMMADQNPKTMPGDGSGKRHAIIFLSQPISAVITYVLLLRDPEFQGIIEPLLMSAKTSTDDRGILMGKMNEPCTPASPHKILITTFGIGAEGFNIQRANNVWFPELPPSLSKWLQAIGRADRQLQIMEVLVEMFTEQGNLVEETGWKALNAKKLIARLLYGV